MKAEQQAVGNNNGVEMVPGLGAGQILVLYDGECGFCQRSVQFILSRDKADRCRFGALQGKTGQRLLKQNGLELEDLSSMRVWDGRQLHSHSDAVMEVLAHLGRPWRWLRVGRMVPRRLRDAVYRLVARNRLKLSGKAACAIPTAAERAKFLND